jgi:hypothetical protein
MEKAFREGLLPNEWSTTYAYNQMIEFAMREYGVARQVAKEYASIVQSRLINSLPNVPTPLPVIEVATEIVSAVKMKETLRTPVIQPQESTTVEQVLMDFHLHELKGSTTIGGEVIEE